MPTLESLTYPGAFVGPLWCVATGRGRPVVLLHGNSEDHHAFDAVVPLLAPYARLVGIDSPGHGASPMPPDGRLTIAGMAETVAEVMGRLGLEGADVVGFSDGANIALEICLRRPGVIGSLVAVGPNLYPDGLRTVSKWQTDTAHALSSVLKRVFPRLHGINQRLSLMVNDPQIEPGELGDVDVPVLVVSGEKDVITREHIGLIADSLPRGRSVVLPGVGHMIPQDAPRALATLVREHLAL